ncbi:uncharacterized protein LOC116917466 [Daphnia magna]|uniref:uncharacterized protein LOC116917466 n=1 Tax=Daphnia magna TaxID=35525 RepID=UPI001E1BB449|nr:uncharacterized protein LOC116917466 [Daphnia magna]
MFETGKKEAPTKVQTRTPLKALFTDNTQMKQGRRETLIPINSLAKRHDTEEQNSDNEPMEVTYSLIVSEENIEPMEATNSFIVSQEDEAITNPVPKKNQKRKYRIKAPIYCSCKKEIKGKCLPCQNRDLKMLVKEKEKQLKIVRSYQNKAKIDLEKLRSRLKEKDKKLNTTRKQLAKMRHYALNVAVTLSKLKEDVVNLTANQLDEKVKHLTHGYAGATALFTYYQRLHNLEKKNHYRRAHKLTDSHINPTNFEKMNVAKAAQLMSDTVAQAIQRYRVQRKFAYLFKGSETTEKFTKLINDVFDVLNGRFVAQGINISNWCKKKNVLDTFLKILDVTEECNRSRKQHDANIPLNMFVSETTLQAWRITVLSVIALAEEQFNADYITVLTGKFNQDPFEATVEKGNVDNDEDMTVLVSYEQCLLNKFKTCEKESTQIRESFKDQLLDELSVRYVNVYCDKCKKGLISKYEDLPTNFLSAEYTAERNHGGLTFATVNLFKIIQKVENVMTKFFDNDSHIYYNSTFNIIRNVNCYTDPR